MSQRRLNCLSGELILKPAASAPPSGGNCEFIPEHDNEVRAHLKNDV
jgi:hypothetical protein